MTHNELTEDVPINADNTAGERDYPLRAYFSNDEGGFWHGFPTITAELQDTLKSVGAYSGDIIANRYVSFAAHLSDCLEAIMQPEDLDEINYLALKLERMSESDIAVLESVLESRKHCDSVKDIINITENLDCFHLKPIFGAERYGEYVMEEIKDNTSDIFNMLEGSDNQHERALAQHILRLEAHVDEAAYGHAVAIDENGAFTEHGYLTEREDEFKIKYRGLGDISPEYRVFAYPEPDPRVKVENVDLSILLLKMHALGGAYMPDAQYNLNILAQKKSSDYLLLMNGSNIYLAQAMKTYQRGTTPFNIWLSAEKSPETKAFAIHVRDQWGNITGDLVEVDFKEHQLDILRNSVNYTEVYAKLKDGTEKTFTADAWIGMEDIARDRIESWTECFSSDGMNSVVRHLEEIRKDHTAAGKL